MNLAIKRRANARLLILNNPTVSLSRLNLLPLIRLVQCEQVFDILEITGESATVRVKEFNFWLYAPFDLVEGTVDEMLSDRYYHEVDVKGKVVVDVGGFIGDTALYFASRGAKSVYVFEPRREFADYAKRNITQFENIFLYDCGLGSGNKTEALRGFAGRGPVLGARIRDASESLTEILKREGRIDLLKVDCEECEWELLTSIDRSLFEHVFAVYVEVHGSNHRALISKLEKFGFTLKKAKRHPLSETVVMYLLERSNVVNDA